MRSVVIALIAAIIAGEAGLTPACGADCGRVKLGNEVLLERYLHLVRGKRIGLVTNQTGIDGNGESIIEIFARHPDIDLRALFAPEHGLDGKAKAGEYVRTYVHPELGIPVYSLYGPTRHPTEDMLQGIDMLLVDLQDIGARSYTYMSTLNYCMVAGKKYNKPVVILDRPNPLGGMRVEGPVLEDRFISFVGVDNLPMAHGMTAGELARFFNRKINANITVIPMEGYSRNMIFQDTGLSWVQTSPNIPDLEACFGYMATGLGEGTGVFQSDKFRWIGGSGLDSERFARALAAENLPGVQFKPEPRGTAGGVRLIITDYYDFNPARTGIYALSTAFLLGNFKVPKSTNNIVMFDKIMGTDEFGRWLEQRLQPRQIEQLYGPGLEQFARERERYLLAEYAPKVIVKVGGKRIACDVNPFIDPSGRVQVPVRAIAMALGAQVQWNGFLQEVSLLRPGLDLRMRIGVSCIRVNGSERTIDTAPVIVRGRTMVPVRFVAEVLGARVRWNGDWLIVHIDP